MYRNVNSANYTSKLRVRAVGTTRLVFKEENAFSNLEFRSCVYTDSKSCYFAQYLFDERAHTDIERKEGNKTLGGKDSRVVLGTYQERTHHRSALP